MVSALSSNGLANLDAAVDGNRYQQSRRRTAGNCLACGADDANGSAVKRDGFDHGAKGKMLEEVAVENVFHDIFSFLV